MHRLQYAGTRFRWLSCSALLALGNVAWIGCGDNADPPADAAQLDAPAAPLDARPPDAAPLDGAPRDAAPRDAAPLDAGSIDAMLHRPSLCDSSDDDHEPNDTSATALALDPAIGQLPGWISGSWLISACMQGTSEDWYRLRVSQIEFDGSDDYDGRPYLRLRFHAKDGGPCSFIAGCDDPMLPEAPENTVTIEMYHAPTMELVAAQTSAAGFVSFNAWDARLEDDLLVRVVGSPEALYDYRLFVYIDAIGSEDECEC